MNDETRQLIHKLRTLEDRVAQLEAANLSLSDADILASVQVTGTWTPNLKFGGASTGITYTSRSGQYIKVGNIAVIAFDMLLSSKGTFSAGDAATITPLPYSPAGSVMYGSGAHYFSGFSSISNAPVAYFSSTSLILLAAASTVAVLTYANFGNTSRLAMTVAYRTS